MRTMLAIGLLVWASATLAVEPAAPVDMPLATAVELAVRDNPGLKSLRARQESMQERPEQAGAPANPMFKYGSMDTASGGSWPNTGEKRFMVEQTFPWAGKRALREGMAQADADAMAGEVDAMTREVVMEVKEAYFDLRSVQQAQRITRGEQAVLKRLADVTESMYTTGARSQQDVIKAQTESTMLRQQLLDLDAQEQTLKAKLGALMNRPADASFGAAATAPDAALGPIPPGLAERAQAGRPELRRARAQLERSRQESRLMEKESDAREQHFFNEIVR